LKETDNLSLFKRHSGINILKPFEISAELEETINGIISGTSLADLIFEAKKLDIQIKERRCPMENSDIQRLRKEIAIKYKLPVIDDRQLESKIDTDSVQVNQKLDKLLHKKMRHWKATQYESEERAMQYLISRFVPELSVMRQIFTEIKAKDSFFKPKNLFDFGSGIGSVMWSAEALWSKSIKEYYNFDSSVHMNLLSQLLIKDGRKDNQFKFNNVVYKRNLPSVKDKYDLVTCSFTLLEVANFKERIKLVQYLWNKVDDNGYLVLVENGTKNGFKLINEAREIILNLIEISNKIQATTDSNSISNDDINEEKIEHYGQIFSPVNDSIF
jgi:ribosomal protein RSM22 (predicted rRNA methylase)